MADYQPPLAPKSPLDRLHDEIVTADPTAVVQIMGDTLVHVSAPKLDVPTLTGLLAKYPDIVPPSALPTAVVLTPVSGVITKL